MAQWRINGGWHLLAYQPANEISVISGVSKPAENHGVWHGSNGGSQLAYDWQWRRKY